MSYTLYEVSGIAPVVLLAALAVVELGGAWALGDRYFRSRSLVVLIGVVGVFALLGDAPFTDSISPASSAQMLSTVCVAVIFARITIGLIRGRNDGRTVEPSR